jgi:hypothetical protein
MKKVILAAAVMVLSFAPSGASAQERVGDAALGALSGAVVLGPVGAVAGAVVGYTAGPAIARSWGLRRSGPGHQERSAKRSATAPNTGSGATQGTPARETVAQGTGMQSSAAEGTAPSARPSSQSASASSAPPVQGYE